MAGKFIDDLVFKVIADTKGAVEGMKKVGDKAQELNRHAKASASGMEAMFGKIKVGAAVAATAVAALGVGLLKIGLDAANAAAQNEESQRRLALTLKNVTGASQESADAVNDWITQVSLAYGISTDNLTPALDQLARATRNVTSSQKILGLAMDVSAGTGIDLQIVATALGEAYKGNFSQLGKLKTGLSNATLETKNFKTVSSELASLFAGQADEAANTFQGQLNRMRVAFKNVQENLGTLLIPVFQLFLNIINKSLIPSIRNFITYLQKNPEVFKSLVKAGAVAINWAKDFAKIMLYVGDASLQLLSLLARVVQGLGWLFGIKGMKDWGRETAETLLVMAKGLDAVGDSLAKFDAKKYVDLINIKDVKLPSLFPDISGGITGGTTPKDTRVASLASDWNDAAKAILEATKSIKTSLTSILNFNFKKVIADLSLDPLTASMNDLNAATKDYVAAQNDLVAKTKASAQADLAYVKSLKDVTDAGKATTQALKEQVDRARGAAIESAQNANQALERIAQAQKAFVDETINRIKSLREAFKTATQISIGGIATSISDAKRNIAQAKENLATAEKALLDAQNKFKSNATSQAYEGVILKTSLPIFEAEKAAVDKAKKDLAVALGEEKNPYAATAEELIKALQNAYDDAVSLSKVAGDLAALGFSQDFITQIIEAGPGLGNELGAMILAADPYTQASMKILFENIQQVSKTGVDQLSIDLNKDAIKAMEKFIEGLKTVEDPLDALMKAIADRVNAMVTSILAAITALFAQIAAMSKIPETKSVTPIKIRSGDPAADAAADAADEAEADAEKLLKESEEALKQQADAEAAKIAALKKADEAMEKDPTKSSLAKIKSLATSADNPLVYVDVSTDADPYEIASATAFALKTKSDGTYAYGAGVSNR